MPNPAKAACAHDKFERAELYLPNLMRANAIEAVRVAKEATVARRR